MLKGIEKLKNPSISSQKVVTDRKNGTETVTTRFRAAMSPFSLLFNLIVTILKKLPIISTYLSIFSEWYKQASTWDKFVALRRFLVAFHALLFVLLVIKVSGYGSINFIAGISSFGGQYFQMLVSTVNKLFEWGHKLFDFIFPKSPPSNFDFFKPSTWRAPWYKGGASEHTWNTRPMQSNGLGKIIDPDLAKAFDFTVKKPEPDSIDWEYWLKKGGTDALYAASAAAIVLIVLKVVHVSTELYGQYHPVANPNVNPATDSGNAGSSSGSNNGPSTGVLKSLMDYNPFKHVPQIFSSSEAQYEHFKQFQVKSNNPRTDQWPFTTDNPNDGIFKKLKLKVFGESKSAEAARKAVKALAAGEQIYGEIHIKDPNNVETSTGTLNSLATSTLTPTMSPATYLGSSNTLANSIGIGNKFPSASESFIGRVMHSNLVTSLSNLVTPKSVPGASDTVANFGGHNSWADAVSRPNAAAANAIVNADTTNAVANVQIPGETTADSKVSSNNTTPTSGTPKAATTTDVSNNSTNNPSNSSSHSTTTEATRLIVVPGQTLPHLVVQRVQLE